MTNRNPTRYYTQPKPVPTRAAWAMLAIKIAALVAVVAFCTMRLAHAGELRAAVIADPASARAGDVRPLIRDDLLAYLSGGTSALGWSMHRTTATQLVDAYRANEVAAQRLYGDGADVVITGAVLRVGITLNTPGVELAADTVGMRRVAAFAPGHDAWLAGLKPGQRVTVACRRTRMVLGMVGAYDCAPRDAYVACMVDSYFFSMHGLAKGGDRMAARLLEIASK